MTFKFTSPHFKFQPSSSPTWWRSSDRGGLPARTEGRAIPRAQRTSRGGTLAFRRVGDQTVLRVRGLKRYQVLLLKMA